MNNLIQMIKGMMGKLSPQQMVMNMLGGNDNPMMNNLKEMAQNGNQEGIEKFARNMFKEQGRDFDKEFADFMSNFK